MPFNRKDHHNFGEIRPRFKLRSSLSQEEIIDLLQKAVDSDEDVSGKKVYGQFYLDIPRHERHFWSPELKVTLEDDEYNEYNGDTIVRVMVGPEYTVWVMFVFIYSFFLSLISYLLYLIKVQSTEQKILFFTAGLR